MKKMIDLLEEDICARCQDAVMSMEVPPGTVYTMKCKKFNEWGRYLGMCKGFSYDRSKEPSNEKLTESFRFRVCRYRGNRK